MQELLAQGQMEREIVQAGLAIQRQGAFPNLQTALP